MILINVYAYTYNYTRERVCVVYIIHKKVMYFCETQIAKISNIIS